MSQTQADSAKISAEIEQMATFDSKASQAVEGAMQEFSALKEQRVRALTNIERLQADLATLEARMKNEYGCDSLEQLLEKAKKIQVDFRKKYADFWSSLQKVRAELGRDSGDHGESDENAE